MKNHTTLHKSVTLGLAHTMNKNIFGTDGIRCAVGTSPLSLEQLPRLGYAIGAWARKKYKNPKALLAHDTRASYHFVKSGLTSGLLLAPVTIYDATILTTPGVCKTIEQDPSFDFGIMISASHNPHQDNGIKLISKNGDKLNECDEQEIFDFFLNTSEENLSYKKPGIIHPWHGAQKIYTHHLQSYFQANIFTGLTVVLDCAHGATYKAAPELFKKLGAQTIVLHDHPTGVNINKECGSLFPHSLQQAVLKHHANIGFAFDGDGDRVIAVNKNGEIKDGDDILALLLDHPAYKEQTNIVGTIMSNQGLAAFLQNKNKKLIRTRVGDKYVSQELEKNTLLLGGEQSGHIILRDYLKTGDGIFTALRVAETMIHTRNWELKTFKKYPQLLINIPVSVKKNLDEPIIAAIIDTYKSKLTNGRLEVRYSGTENKLRVMVEDLDQSNTQLIAQQLSQELKKELSH